jgi:Uma2 family endonuclease
VVRVPVSAGTLDGFRAWYSAGPLPRGVRCSFLAGTIRIEIPGLDFALRIPPGATTLDGFRAWATSAEFPRRGRISFLHEELLIDMSPEEIETHAKVKDAVTRAIGNLNEELDLGELFPDRTLVGNTATGLSTEPDATFVKWQSYRAGRVHLIPRRDRQGQFTEVQGRPDWVLEVISDSSVHADRVEMRALYHGSAIPEFWLIDARGEEIDFQILAYRRDDYVPVAPRNGWHRSRVFGRRFRLERHRNRMGRWRYQLLVDPTC